ncbi:uncharacterized protein [Canis lupus baileyi]|uniref:uncharacterized protein LOC119870842 isoform X3 n=1 Tax=Canis lupus familiaris TaxID=9615 RepID=UPI0015F157A5|nr:uncharacterized protein LOC119870842 isoform X3 [Canis lupus familiaris]XP_038451889.1 uncharacterized protein LOC119870842 isoform X3 [Canis lupus familiaris]XP_038511250.1 uncharacterized protein LOC119870842 isoform X3 [Canis lupus familiaris]
MHVEDKELLSAFMTTLRTKIYVLRMVEQENEKRLGPQCYHRAAEERREQISPQEGGRHKVKFLKASREVPLPSPLTQRRRKHPAPFGSHPERQACSSHPIPSGHKMTEFANPCSTQSWVLLIGYSPSPEASMREHSHGPHVHTHYPTSFLMCFQGSHMFLYILRENFSLPQLCLLVQKGIAARTGITTLTSGCV